MVKLKSTVNWQFSDMPTAQIIYVRLDAINEVTEAIILMLSAASRLFDSLNKLLQLTLILIAIVLAGAEMAVSLCNRLYGAYSGYNEAIDRYFNGLFSWLFWTPVRGIG